MKMLLYFELKKILMRSLSIAALLCVILLSAMLAFSTYQNKYAFDGRDTQGSGKEAVEIDKRVAAKYQGKLTDEKVQQMMADFAPTYDLQGMNAIYLYQNATQSAAFARFADQNGNWNGLAVADVFGDQQIVVGYVDGWLSTSKDMVKGLVALSLALIAMVTPIFSSEYEGVDNIILTSRYGKTRCSFAKIIAGMLTALFATALVTACQFLFALLLYGAEGWDCSILFTPIDYVEGFVPFNITCGTLLKYQLLLAFTSALSTTGITLFLSAISKNQIAAFAASLAIFLFPALLPVSENSPLFGLVSLFPLYQVLAYPLLSVEQMEGGLLYAVWAIPVSLIVSVVGALLSRRAFAAHQVC